jgi:hypothetical protein
LGGRGMTEPPENGRLGRAEKNELAFQQYNERRAAFETATGLWEDASVPFVCECDDPDCVQAVQLSPVDYERFTAPADRFIVKTGHEDPAVEVVVDEYADFLVVSKPGLKRHRRD